MKRPLPLLLALTLLLSSNAALASLTIAGRTVLTDEFSFTLGGSVYCLPCPVTDLMNDGWVSSLSEIGGYAPGMGSLYDGLSRDGANIDVQLANYSTGVRAVEELSVKRIEVSASSGVSFALGNGITPGMSVREVLDAIGASIGANEDDYFIAAITLDDNTELLTADDTHFAYSYELSLSDDVLRLSGPSMNIGENSIELHFDGPVVDENSRLERIVLDCTMPTAADLAHTATIDETRPELYGRYSAPASLGGDLHSMTFAIDGVPFGFPAPMSELGALPIDESIIVPGQGEIAIDIADWDVSISVANPLGNGTPVRNGFLQALSIYSGNTNITLPGGLKIGSSEQELLAFMPVLSQAGSDPVTQGDMTVRANRFDGYSSYYLQYGSDFVYAQISIQCIDGVISCIDLLDNTWIY